MQFKLKAKKSDTNAYLPLTKKELAFFEDIPKELVHSKVKLDQDVYYSLEVENVPVLFPDGSYVKQGDLIVRKKIDKAVGGRCFNLYSVARVPDITDEGNVYWVSFENKNLRVTKDMVSEVLEYLNPDKNINYSRS